jgi:hypothetical protein
VRGDRTIAHLAAARRHRFFIAVPCGVRIPKLSHQVNFFGSTGAESGSKGLHMIQYSELSQNGNKKYNFVPYFVC